VADRPSAKPIRNGTGPLVPDKPAPSVPGLYVHVPFCKTKCPYCDFYSVTTLDLVDRFVEDLEHEMRWRLADAWMDGFDSLYVGGGTPSILGPERLQRVLAMLSRPLITSPRAKETAAPQSRPAGRTPGEAVAEKAGRTTKKPAAEGASSAPDVEVTVEMNPADVTADLMAVMRDAGVTRVSLGVQSFDDQELRLLGRRHDRAGAIAAIEEIRKAGFADLGLDIITDLPGSNLETLRRSLDQALAFRPEHLSCYALTIAEGTVFGQRQQAGTLVLPDPDARADQYLETARVLEEAGYDHYEVSNYARKPRLRSRHNQKYWNRTPYLGLGPAAHSFDGTTRWWNLADVHRYHERLSSGHLPVDEQESIDADMARMEQLALGMRTAAGISETLVQRPGLSEVAADLVAQGLLERHDGRLCPTRRGFLVADGIAALLV